MVDLDPRLLDQCGMLMNQHRLNFFDVCHLWNRSALGDVAIAFELSETFAEMCDLEMPLTHFPDLSLRQQWWPAVPSQFHSYVLLSLDREMESSRNGAILA